MQHRTKATGQTYLQAPPCHPGRIAGRILMNPEYTKMWESEMKQMYTRIRDVRKGLKDRLIAKKTPGNWDHLVKQVGIHSDLGLTGKS